MRAPFVGALNKTHLLIDWEARDGELFNFIMLVGEREEIVRGGLTSNDTVIERREGLTEVTSRARMSFFITIKPTKWFDFSPLSGTGTPWGRVN